jgi:hypothetical protein
MTGYADALVAAAAPVSATAATAAADLMALLTKPIPLK